MTDRNIQLKPHPRDSHRTSVTLGRALAQVSLAVPRADCHPNPAEQQGSWVDVFEGTCFDGRLRRLALKPSAGHTHRKCATPIGSMIVGPRAAVEVICGGRLGPTTVKLEPGRVVPTVCLPGNVLGLRIYRC